MSVVGTPDFQEGSVTPTTMLAHVAHPTTSVVVTMPANTISLSLILHFGDTAAGATCVGATTRISYPGVYIGGGTENASSSSLVTFQVAPSLDATVTITLGATPLNDWYVYSTTLPTILIEPNVDGIIKGGGAATDDIGLVVAGQDGVSGSVRVLITDSSGQLLISNPGSGLEVTIGGAIGTLMTPVGGSDGTDARVMLVDSSGHALTIDQNIKLVVAATGAAIPADAVLIGGSDGTDLRALAADSTGHLIPQGPNATTGLFGVTTSSQTLLAAPGSGNNYLYGLDFSNTGTGANKIEVKIGGVDIAWSEPAATAGYDHVHLAGYKTNSAVTVIGSVTGGAVVLRYAAGP